MPANQPATSPGKKSAAAAIVSLLPALIAIAVVLGAHYMHCRAARQALATFAISEDETDRLDELVPVPEDDTLREEYRSHAKLAIELARELIGPVEESIVAEVNGQPLPDDGNEDVTTTPPVATVVGAADADADDDGGSEADDDASVEDVDEEEPDAVETAFERADRILFQPFLMLYVYRAVIVFCMSVLPFGAMAISLGLANRNNLEQRLNLLGTGRQHFARRFIFAKFILAASVAFFWVFHLCPLGEEATLIAEFAKQQGPLYVLTFPEFLSINTSPTGILLSGMMGWYIHLVMTVTYRSLRCDVLSQGVFRVEITRLLIVIGTALLLGLQPIPGTQILVFLLGVFPTVALGILVERVKSAANLSGRADAPLEVLQTIPVDKITRLQEEGVNDVADMVTSRKSLDVLGAMTGIDREQLADWIDAAILCSIVGPNRYALLAPFFTTASRVVHAVHTDPDNLPTFEEQSTTFNLPEIATRAERLLENSMIPPVS
ncbi:MAG: hypothetical protein QGG36_27645 [Pirellulaceae bacterium]|nr:hypothetical protein [Pirellulaceae bacterium]